MTLTEWTPAEGNVEGTPADEVMEGSPAEDMVEGTPAHEVMGVDEADTPSTDLEAQPSEEVAELQSGRAPAPATEAGGLASLSNGLVGP